RRGIVLPWCSAARSASHAPVGWRDSSPAGFPPQYKPPTRSPRRDPGLRPRADWLVDLFNASSQGLGWPGVVAARPCGRPGGKAVPLSGAVAASGAVTQTLSGERPAGLRTTRAEPDQAMTAPAVRQALVCFP